jgi:hypothetical protein
LFISLFVALIVKLDPSTHKGMHSVFALKLGVTGSLYKLLKKFDSFRWMEETQKTLDKLKTLITKLPVLASPEPGETIVLHIVATT